MLPRDQMVQQPQWQLVVSLNAVRQRAELRTSAGTLQTGLNEKDAVHRLSHYLERLVVQSYRRETTPIVQSA